MHIKTWHVEVFLDEEGDRTVARAVLHTEALTHLEGHGETVRNPGDRDVPEIGDEVAAARALHDLSDALLGAAAGDISAIEQKPPVHLGFEAPTGAGR
jgi:hypothetical protein